MEMDAKMDHGPIVRQTPYTFTDWPSHIEARKILAHIGGKTLAETISPWVHGTLIPLVQNHEDATFTKLFTKNDAELELEASDQYAVYRRFLAFTQWIEPYFFYRKIIVRSELLSKKHFLIKRKNPLSHFVLFLRGKKK
jgi:methionyl-tRNA formyltransferase